LIPRQGVGRGEENLDFIILSKINFIEKRKALTV
jgi:hypothetical protein